MRLITVLIKKRVFCDSHLSHSHLSNAVPLLRSKREVYTEAHIRTDLVSVCVFPLERQDDTERTYGPHYESHGL